MLQQGEVTIAAAMLVARDEEGAGGWGLEAGEGVYHIAYQVDGYV